MDVIDDIIKRNLDAYAQSHDDTLYTQIKELCAFQRARQQLNEVHKEIVEKRAS